MRIDEIRILSGSDKTGNSEGVDELSLRRGEVLVLAGSTGSGKSLLLSDIEQLADGDSPSGRRVLVDGRTKDPFSFRITACLSQNMNFVMDLDVGDFIRLHAKSRKIDSPGMVNRVLDLANDLTGEPLAPGMHLSSLSGGQSRALMIADAALISNAPVVLIDEIENAGINKTKGIGVLSTEGKMVLIATHDPTLMLTAEKRVIMKNGAMSKLIRSDEMERRHLKYLLRIDTVLGNLRQRLRLGETLDEYSLQALDTLQGEVS
ncbi:ATP-binding cassette domain-containing protein [Desulfoplanes sp. PS50]